MPILKTYDLFLSHSWRYNSDYDRLIELLRNASYFKFRDYSIPVHRPKVDPNSIASVRFVTIELEKQIKPANCILLMAGVYSTHSEWIRREISLAQKYDKPIIGIVPWGQRNVSSIVQNAAHDMVNWNTVSIVNAIRKNSI
jgi:hypothetical protein